MPTYQYEALNTVGQTVKGQIDAITSEEAAAKVRAMGNFPTKIKERAARRRKGDEPAGAAAYTAASRPRC